MARDPDRRLSRRRHRRRQLRRASAATWAACRCSAPSTTSQQVIATLDAHGERPQRLILCAQTLDGAAVRQLLDLADELGIPLARLPRLTEFQETLGDDTPAIEPIAIEDLLGRPQTVLDRAGMRALIAGKRVLVTGAGGTIGAELVRQIAACEPGAPRAAR